MLHGLSGRQSIKLGVIVLLGLLWALSQGGPSVWGAGQARPMLRPLAHGGVVIDAGFTDAYEWLVALGPYPVTSGEAVVTLNVFDVDTGEPIRYLDATILLAPPGSSPCCDASQHLGPVPLTTDPIAFPGDYSAIVPFDTAGKWAIQFTAAPTAQSARAQMLQVIVEFEVEARGDATALPPLGTPNAATATTFAGRVAEARRRLDGTPVTIASPLQATSPISVVPVDDAKVVSPPRRWWLWGALLLVPVVALAGWMLRESPDE